MQETEVLRLIPLREVERMAGISKSEIWRRINAGRFPRPVKLGENARAGSRWEFGEVQGWVQARLSERKARHTEPQPIAA